MMAIAGSRLFISSHSPWGILVCTFVMFTAVRTAMYESIQWSPQNPKFRFSKEKFANGDAYYRMAVMTTSSIYFVCPNPTTIFGVTEMSIPKEELNENLWMVDKTSFETCNINRNSTKNKLLFQCIWLTDSNRFQSYKVVFQRYSAAASGLEFNPGQEYYFIATSNGLENSVNNTSGGHCKDEHKNISMRVVFYICRNSSDCSQNKDKPSNSSTVPVSNSTTEPPARESSARSSSCDETFKFLAIGFGGGFFVAICCCCILCYVIKRSRENRRKNRQDPEPGCKLPAVPEKKPSIGQNGCEPAGIDNKGIQSQISQVSTRADDSPLLNSESHVKKTLLQRDPNKVTNTLLSNGKVPKPPVPKPRREAPRAPTPVKI